MDPVIAVFDSFCDPTASIPSEQKLTEAIDQLKTLCTSAQTNASSVESLSPRTILILLRIFFDIRQTVSYCRTTLQEIIGFYLKKANSESVAAVVKDWLLFRLPSGTNSVHFTAGSSGGVAAIKGENKEVLDLQERIEFWHQLTDDLPSDFRSRLFDDCLGMVVGDRPQGSMPSSQDPFETLSILSFVVSLIERDSALASGSRKRMVNLLKVLLDQNSDGGDSSEEQKSLKKQNLLLTLGMVGAFLSTGEFSDAEEEGMRDLKFKLKELGDKHPDVSVSTAAKDIFCLLLLSSSSIHDAAPTEMPAAPSQQLVYNHALLDLDHPLIPVRAHALIALTNLIKSKDSSACSNIDALIPKFIDRLEEEDSYVYLAAVNSLAAAGLYRPKVILPVLMTLFKSTDDTDQRLKIGEAVVKISQGLGDLAPFYGNDLINGFLSLLKDGNDEVKASCLANVAEVCRLMTFRLNTSIHELFYCAKQLLQWEKNALVRRAAINLLALLAENGDSFLEVLGDLSRDYYRFVKDVYEHDEDHVVRLHAQKCLESLGEHAKKFMKPLIVPL